MRTVLPIVLYTWLAVSLFIYGRRLYRRSAARPSAEAETSPLPPTGAAPAAPAAARAPDRPVHVPHVARPAAVDGPAPPPLAPDDLAVAPPSFAADGTPQMDATHFPLEPAVAAALAEEGRISTPGGTGPTTESGRAGLFAKVPTGEEAPVPLATLIAGISLPCDLAPLVSLDNAHLADVRACFVTSGHDPAQVGGELGDELERLGFALSTLADNVASASRADGRLTVTIHTNPHTLEVDGVRSFPTTAAGDVVVELASV